MHESCEDSCEDSKEAEQTLHSCVWFACRRGREDAIAGVRPHSLAAIGGKKERPGAGAASNQARTKY